MAYIIATEDETTPAVNFTTVGDGFEIKTVLNQTQEEQTVELIFPRLITIAPPNEVPAPGPGGGGTYSWGNA